VKHSELFPAGKIMKLVLLATVPSTCKPSEEVRVSEFIHSYSTVELEASTRNFYFFYFFYVIEREILKILKQFGEKIAEPACSEITTDLEHPN
jgi:hypothetical protein